MPVASPHTISGLLDFSFYLGLNIDYIGGGPMTQGVTFHLFLRLNT